MKKSAKILSILLLLFIGLSAIGGGGMLIYDRTGISMKFPLDLLDQTPFNNYLIPGIILFLFVGIFSLLVAFMVIRNLPNYPWFIFLQGLVLIVWLIVELFLNIDFYHPIYHIPLSLMSIYLIIVGLRLRKWPNI